MRKKRDEDASGKGRRIQGNNGGGFMTNENAIKLIEVHTEARRSQIRSAFQAMSGLSKLDRLMVMRWCERGDLSEGELGVVIADYRHSLGQCYGTAK